MATGMEMLVSALLKAVGFDKDEAIQKGNAIYDSSMRRLTELEAQLNRIEFQNTEILACLRSAAPAIPVSNEAPLETYIASLTLVKENVS
jgi:hypothetical protein